MCFRFPTGNHSLMLRRHKKKSPAEKDLHPREQCHALASSDALPHPTADVVAVPLLPPPVLLPLGTAVPLTPLEVQPRFRGRTTWRECDVWYHFRGILEGHRSKYTSNQYSPWTQRTGVCLPMTAHHSWFSLLPLLYY